jgi:hypothetical protein
MSSSTGRVGLVPMMPGVAFFPGALSRKDGHHPNRRNDTANDAIRRKWERAYQRANAVRSRPSTLAAQEFFSQPSSCGWDIHNDWRTLPARLEALCHYLDHPTKKDVSRYDNIISLFMNYGPLS